MFINDRVRREATKGTDFPRFEGHVKLILHNPTTGKTEIHEKHNDPTNALADIFSGNYGGLVDYDNMQDLYKTWLGGVLVFAGGLDTTSAGWADDYGIPAKTSNECVAHAGQTPIGEAPYDQADDSTRGNPDNSGIVTTVGSTKMCWEWGTSAGNAPVISSLGLTHTDVGSYGCGVASETQKLLNPFAEIGCKSKTYSEYGDNAKTPLGVNGNMAYSFYIYDDNGTTKVHIYKTPMNVNKYKLQGGSLEPLYAYTTQVNATLASSYNLGGHGDCYYHFDFANNKLILFGVPTLGGDDLYKDTIDLDSGNAVHDDIEVTGAYLWKFRIQSAQTGFGDGDPLPIPTKAMVYNNHLFVYGLPDMGEYSKQARKIYSINLANTSDISEVDTTSFNSFESLSVQRAEERFAMLGGIIVHDSFLINGDKTYQCSLKTPGKVNLDYGIPTSISSPCFGIGTSLNSVAVNKLYLATKWNLDSSVAKTSAMSMRIEYSLTEV